ncbi:hypothetical protein PCCS19_15870 [Paenibacillus sp. CCS19]|uniref:hypothetical protein n=1 Tax=Paenibacillus sp. CCS19 TaxID=3158387 RepID=UPI00256AEE84|nr:hypothetical protein [Paenibacillus cellulosilyticus]GMK38533.1 hypothetical protein PCCS19_15870 [Paenibacillus cellulosilyticus]
MSIIKLSGVELTQSPPSKCKHCKGLLAVRKLEVLYESNQRKGHTAYLVTDVWYCARCDRGYLLDALKTVLDSSNRSWRAVEIGVTKSAGSDTRPQTQQAKVTQQSGQAAPVSKLPRIEAIDFVIGDQLRNCVNCGGSLTKHNIELRIAREDHAVYVPCEAYQCDSCRRWMLRRQQYATLQTSNSPYVIHVLHNDRIYESLSHLTNRSKLAQRSDAGLKSPGQQPTDKLNNQFNKYGVFIPAPTNKKGYFDE